MGRNQSPKNTLFHYWKWKAIGSLSSGDPLLILSYRNYNLRTIWEWECRDPFLLFPTPCGGGPSERLLRKPDLRSPPCTAHAHES
jgi:hypothetical protein